MKNILHITPHLGGGIGTVLLNWLTYDKYDSHSVITLDYANDNAVSTCKANNIPLFPQLNYSDISEKIKGYDIVVIHFWNHPLLYDFLIRTQLPESRLIFWSHVSGANPPYVFNEKLFNMCEKFVFTTPLSFKYVTEHPKFATILSTGGTEKFLNLEKEKHEGFNIGYIGTIDFAKMHPDYIETVSKTEADKIYITGGGKNSIDFENLSERFVVTGKVNNVAEILSKLDVFAYMLNPNHYGTGEQVIQEAMASGVVPVVMNNPCEMSLVKHLETGLIAKSAKEFIDYVNLLKNDTFLREKLSKNAREYARKNFSVKNLTEMWRKIFDEVMEYPKTSKKWFTDKSNFTSYDIFLESLGKYRDIFEGKTKEELKAILKQPNWNSDTKGTPKQYYDFLGGEELAKICELY